MNTGSRGFASALVAVLLLSLAPVHAQTPLPPSVTITTHWIGEGTTDTAHAYLLTFSDNGSFGIDVQLHHERNESFLASSQTIAWGSAAGLRTAVVTFNTSLEWSDNLEVVVNILSHNGIDVDVEVSRSIEIGRWNQPMDDHEVMLSTSWALDQSYDNEEGQQRFALAFTGQGWQERVGDTLSSWELGNGTFQTLETTPDGASDLDLVLTQLWKNETVVGGVLTSQVFDARGYGGLQTTLLDGGTETVVQANVSQALLNRSYIDGIIGEHLLLEATGVLNVSEEGEENDSLDIDGELAVFFFEYRDIDGVRVLQHTQFEAMADLVVVDDGSRLDVALDGFTSLERWENGVRTEHLEELYGGGTFGFADQDENASVQVNGTILDLHTKIENGTTLIDDLHVDGTLTGDVQGSFGVLRSIETTGMQANATGDAFLVNVIFQESWFNITGINGGNFFDGAGVGATHNETWDYQVVQSDWDNRTVRLVWRETGPDASEGDELPEHSPVQQNATAPSSEEGLGDLTVGRETGWMPIPMQTGDRLRLNGQDGITLTVQAGQTGLDTRDGHNLTVIEWTGVYEGSGEDGNASGALVSVGPLKGLLSSVQRQLSLPFGEENETVVLQEQQVLERVLSPEIVSEDDNNPPVIGEIGLREGLVLGEGGGVAHLEVVVSDAEWNTAEVNADLSALGLGTVLLNDRGLGGDLAIGDDVYTTSVVVKGLSVGELNLSVHATDSFGASTSAEGSVLVVNQAPRITDIELAPTSLLRGQSVVINVDAYDGHGVSEVQVDLREYGGEIVNLSPSDGTWAAMMAMPVGMSPGERSLLLVVTDTLGASAQHRTYAPATGVNGHDVFGPHHVNADEPLPIVVDILNDRPRLVVGPQTVEKRIDLPVVFSVEASDPDGIERVQIDLGVYAPVGVSSWVSMHDDGINGGDEIAGDGIYSVLLSLREGTPLGTHEVFVRSLDTYGELNTSSTVIKLEEPDETGTVDEGLSTTVLGALGLGIFVAAGGVLAMMWRRQDGDGDGTDRFGSQ